MFPFTKPYPIWTLMGCADLKSCASSELQHVLLDFRTIIFLLSSPYFRIYLNTNKYILLDMIYPLHHNNKTKRTGSFLLSVSTFTTKTSSNNQALSTTITSPCCSLKKSSLPSLTQLCMQMTLVLSTWPTSENQIMTRNVITPCFACSFSLAPWVHPTTTQAELCLLETSVLIRGRKTLAQPRTIATFWWQIYRICHIVLPSSRVPQMKLRASSM